MKERRKTKSFTEFEKLLNYHFKDPSLLERALTHRSWAHEQIAPGREDSVKHLHNEVIEFVGDSVLGLTIAHALFDSFPHLDEGELSLMKHRLVSAPSLAQVSEKLRLSKFLKMGRGEERTGGRGKQTILADATEAIIGAIFLDGGYPAAREFVQRLFADELQTISPARVTDYKTLLQERLQAEHRAAPSYTVVRTEGPPHRRTFFVEARWDTGSVEGHGTTIKTAAMMAAKLAIEKFDPAPTVTENI